MHKKVLVTGGTGFLGGHVAVRLRQLGHSVTILDRNEKIGNALESQGFKFHKVDITDDAAVLKASEGQECIVHCAGLAAAHGKYDTFYQVNVVGTRNVVQSCKKSKVKHLVNISSPGVYFNYQDRMNIRESDPLPEKQATPYAATKLLAEEIIDHAVAEGLSAISLRPRGIFGPGDNIYLPAILKNEWRGFFPLVDGGRAYVDMTYIDNVVDAVVLAMEPRPALNGEKFNITNGEPMMFREIVQKLFRSLHKEIRFINLPFSLLYRAGAILEFLCEHLPTEPKPFLTKYGVGLVATSQTHDISKAKELLGYLPKVSIEEGFRRFALSREGPPGSSEVG
jgi:nucleoside-diphosphate-sugar epimerase